MACIKWIKNECFKQDSYRSKYFDQQSMNEVYNIHKSLTAYRETNLINLKKFSNYLGIKSLFIKDESVRMNLSSFKVLGGSYVVARAILEELNCTSFLNFNKLHVSCTGLSELTFVAATDGNHGRGVAWAADLLGYPSIIYMPKGSCEARVRSIESLGAKVNVTDLNYDKTVGLAADFAYNNNYRMVQDTYCKGCDKAPIWVMQGYLTIMKEIICELNGEVPTHIFLQAGVGAFAGAVTAFLRNYYKEEEMPTIVVVEAENSECYYESIKNEELTTVDGELDTIMAGLACGNPNPIAWEILSKSADYFVVCSNDVAARGMRILGSPLDGDRCIRAGESGAVTAGLVSFFEDEVNTLRNELNINKQSKILLINTEGDTDPHMYKRIIWNGAYSNEEANFTDGRKLYYK